MLSLSLSAVSIISVTSERVETTDSIRPSVMRGRALTLNHLIPCGPLMPKREPVTGALVRSTTMAGRSSQRMRDPSAAMRFRASPSLDLSM
ncbi:MAG: hypothetical protein A4E29_01563 [Methanomassiliicoccales archaeon PtaB.Bin134]|nr:MAG: hypothetical protein A4E29_01563 [Methanomassiliicoccales archaeon PtaB.Bin134]